MLEASIGALDASLPWLLSIAAMAILTGNHFARAVLVDYGLSLRARQYVGFGCVVAALAMWSGITSCHATTGLIAVLIGLSINAIRLNRFAHAVASSVFAATLVPVVAVS
ncbi:MAG: hypothetical protein O9320_12895 [Magnetospirillum sp.]|nr:hypothetical protein [Magnetospirillum sp.]